VTLSQRELDRYQRQMMIDGWGEKAQRKLKETTVFVAGAGGLGSPVAIYLAVAGVGRIRICDFDSPEYSNLNRQIVHDPTRIGVNKAISAQMTLEAMNPDIEVVPITDEIVPGNVEEIVGDAAIMLDCMDNFPTRYLLNEVALRKRIPLVHGAVSGIDGRLTFLQPPDTACLRCLVPEAPPEEVFPVLGATPGVIGSLQVVEALKYLTGVGEPLKERLLVWEGGRTRFTQVRFRKDPECPTCGSPTG
jgi:adenylyltransferase/sulfurtransferase